MRSILVLQVFQKHKTATGEISVFSLMHPELGLDGQVQMLRVLLHTHKAVDRHIIICNRSVLQFVGTELRNEQVWG